MAAHLAHGCSLGACDEQGICSNSASKIAGMENHMDHSFEMLVSPNPFADRIEIEMLIIEDGAYEIELMNLFGQVVKHVYKGSLISAERNKFEMNTSELGKGVYFLRAKCGDGRVVLSKILKM